MFSMPKRQVELGLEVLVLLDAPCAAMSARSMAISSSSSISGLVRKSNAPARMASIAPIRRVP